MCDRLVKELFSKPCVTRFKVTREERYGKVQNIGGWSVMSALLIRAYDTEGAFVRTRATRIPVHAVFSPVRQLKN